MAEIPWTADQVEAMFRGALRTGDVKGVDATLKVMARLDAERAASLRDDLSAAVKTEMTRRGLGGTDA